MLFYGVDERERVGLGRELRIGEIWVCEGGEFEF